MRYTSIIFFTVLFLLFAMIKLASDAHCAMCGVGRCMSSSQCFSGCVCLIGSGELTGECYSIE